MDQIAVCTQVGSLRFCVIMWCVTCVMPGLAIGEGSFGHRPFSEQRGSEEVSTHGVIAGDVTSTSAVIWARSNKPATMHVLVKPQNGFGRSIQKQTPVDLARDFTGKIRVKGLQPDTAYRYIVWFGETSRRYRPHRATVGTFRTAPRRDDDRPVRFAWGGDVAGQNVCRDQEGGFPIFQSIAALELDFFVGLGDMIYADGLCEPVGLYGNPQIPGNFVQAADLPNYWAHWKYVREDHVLQQFLAHTPYYAVWDDHEVVNDFGPLHDTRDTAPYKSGEHLLPIGLQAFLAYNPIVERNLTPERVYRHARWGKHLEMIFLDNRQYRDANLDKDDAQLVKTMLGREQLTWLKRKLHESTATWKVIVSSVPISIPTGFPPELGRDGWSNFDQDTGFEWEMTDVLDTIQSLKLRNVIFITTDVHFAEVFRYTPTPTDSGFHVHEFVTGPMNAGLFPNRDFDDTLGAESLFFYGPDNADAVTTWEEAKPWMNFGYAEVDGSGHVTVSIRNGKGKTVFETMLPPER